MTISRSPEWMPSGTAARLPCGRWWDAVAVAASVADGVFAGLAEQGLVTTALRDRVRETVAWLVRPGAADRWPDLPRVEIHRAGATLEIPPAAWHPTPWSGGPALAWTSPPAGTCLTSPGPLLTALETGVRRG